MTIEESVVMAMDGTDIELYPYLSYILQDIWEIGSDPDVIIKVIKNHFTSYSDLKLLDLGCGKGAVSIKIAKELGCHCYGIDALSDFINYANQKAIEFNVGNLCKFEIADIRKKVNYLFDYDIILLGSIGPVFGDLFTTITRVSKCLNRNGIIIIDEGYIDNSSSFTHPLIMNKRLIDEQIEMAGMVLVTEYIADTNDIKETDDFIFDNLIRRCNELIDMYPDKTQIFNNYIKNQVLENDVLENKIVCSTMVIKYK